MEDYSLQRSLKQQNIENDPAVHFMVLVEETMDTSTQLNTMPLALARLLNWWYVILYTKMLWVQSPGGEYRGGNQSMFLSLPLSLSKINKNMTSDED